MTDILTYILKYGLSIRQIPLEVVSLLEPQYAKPGNTFISAPIKKANAKEAAWLAKHLGPDLVDHIDTETHTVYRRYVRHVTTPNFAGWWMVQAVPNTNSTVRWSTKTHHLRKTLEESVLAWVMDNGTEEDKKEANR